MKHVKEEHRNNWLYGGVARQEYLEIEEEVREKNRSSLGTTSICLILMFAGLFLGSLFSDLMTSNRKVYAAAGIGFLIIQITCRIMKKRGKHFIMLLWYVAMTLILIYAVILNTVIRNDISATTFCVIMIVAPLLIIDRPWRVFVYFSAVVGLFIWVDFHQKSYYLAFTDTVNALCCFFLGSVIHMWIMQTKLREMLHKRQIEKERDTDKLTGCLTKAAFERRILEGLDATGQCGALLVMDLDYFKSVNDNYGHVFGDMVLRTMGACIQENFPETKLYGRFGGDEFQVWLPGTFMKKDLATRLDKLLASVHEIETPDDRVQQLGTSIGVAVCPENGRKYSELFENADAALYTAKELGRNRYIFCPDIRTGSKA